MSSHTLPWTSDVASLITGTHSQYVDVVATPDGGTPVELGIIGGNISLDESRSPRVSGTLDVALDDEQLVQLLDPRLAVRVGVWVTYVLPNGSPDRQLCFDLHLRRRLVGRPGLTLQLPVASDEALVIDSAPSVAVTTGEGGETIEREDSAEWIKTLIQQMLWHTEDPDDIPVVVTAPHNLTASWPVDTSDYWQDISDVADQLDLDVYDPGDRTFRVEKRPAVASSSVLTVKGGPNGILLSSDAGVDRDDWANCVFLRYQWRNAAGVDQTVYGTARVTGGPYAVTAVGYKILTEVRTTPTTEGSANRAAETILRRMLSRSRGLTFQAVPAWWLRPGRTVTVQLPGNDETRHIVSRVDFDLAADVMTVSTRLPDTDSTLGE